ncbi:alpha/beta fold hydrolase [Mesonia maritima]|uniref:Pimeloyl-ACP methyl ester carboxylesterase n=1 Tax=Mesonia maritima TaxID=1793873 RepID=A0ABU1K2M6_9FLAO|nr:alpha/beta hydrolase [Mesonia maritima]MDR6299858.1 pimeloyl-ACP methyl ester carboxylesterase [Mesonia maritima]
MPFITTEKEKKVDIYYEDFGKGQPVILIHGWPLSHKSWEGQVATLVDAGYRVISYDRRGFGSSSAPWGDYDYSTLAQDLRKLILELDLNDCIIVGFSMGGGEVVRYFTDYGNDRIAKAALISSIIPLVKKKDDNPKGVPEEDLQDIMKSLKSNRIGFLKEFHKNFYNYDEMKNKMSEAQLDYDWSIASHASPIATIKCAEAWAETDFREELKNVNVPTLIVHGAADNIVPIESAGDQAAKGIKDNTYEVFSDGPHGLNVTHKVNLNEKLLHFFKK